MTIQAVLFDLDNTLTHRDLTAQAYSRSLAEHYAPALAQVEPEKIIEIVRRIDNGGYPKKELLTHGSIGASAAYALLQELSWLNPPSIEELAQFWFSQFGRCAVEVPDAKQVLEQLKSQGYQLAIVSNGGHDTRLNTIRGLGIAGYFDEIISSGLVGFSKPQPEIFQITAQRLGVLPEHCLYIGDHPVNDIQGAKNAGMHALWMQGFHPDAEEIQYKIQQLPEIFTHLQRLNQL
ncbi:HAD family hydrolase [Acinetobacter pseudolwoffii]|uniref:HAD family hydrolase n=1 Tax=Acinetobacter pseudolwoffii TaxID=2053287 RepID=A0A2H9YUF6_9GAMM|nr:HAD family hydrolase [Acinetobacter pseudolwoffii]PJO76268.1 HAD family hydrolase [Acinetobacter pseudolwoffii]